MYIQASHSLQVTSSRHRSQAQNISDALSKVCGSLQLHAEILRIAVLGLCGETSSEQRKRVASLERAAHERKKLAKQKRSMTKSGRRATP